MSFITKMKQMQGAPSLRRELHKVLAGYRPERSHKIVHASDLFSQKGEFCPRYFALLDITGKKPKDEFLSTSLSTTFAFGGLIQDWLIEVFAEADIAVTDWKCRNCGAVAHMCKRPHACSQCGYYGFRPIEHRFKSEVSDISCGVDMFAEVGDGKLRVVEIKSIDKEEFKKLAGPYAEHRYRTNLYLRIINESEDSTRHRVDLNEAFIFYMSKGGFGVSAPEIKDWGFHDHSFSPFKEYIVQRNDEATEAKVGHAIRLKQFREGTKGIPLGLCPTSFCPRAKKCSLVGPCFSGDYPGDE